MSKRESQAIRSLEVVLDYAISRLEKLEGNDKIALENEYKEWLVDEELKEQVWFSVPLENKY